MGGELVFGFKDDKTSLTIFRRVALINMFSIDVLAH
jgi:hypothetical protein